MMPVMMVAPMMAVAPGTMTADLLRSEIGHDNPTAGNRVIVGIAVIGIIIVIRISIPGAPNEDAAEAVVSEPMPAVPAAAGKRRAGAEGTAVKDRGTRPATPSAMPAMPAMSTTNLDREIVTDRLVHRRSGRIEQG